MTRYTLYTPHRIFHLGLQKNVLYCQPVVPGPVCPAAPTCNRLTALARALECSKSLLV